MICHRCEAEGDHGDSWKGCVHASFLAGFDSGKLLNAADVDRIDYLNARRQDGEKWTYTHYTFDDRFRFYIGCWKGSVGTFEDVRECIDFARGVGI